MHQFTLSIYCLALTPLTYGVKAGLLAAFTTIFMLSIRKVVRRSKYRKSAKPGVWNALRKFFPILGFSVLFGFLTGFFTTMLMSIIFSWNVDGVVCLHFIGPTILEMCIPLTGCIYIAAKSIETRFFRIIKYPVMVVFFGCIGVSVFLAVKEILFY